jgi:hypothetical protein
VKASGTVDLEQQHRSAGVSPDFMGLDPLSVAAVLVLQRHLIAGRLSRSVKASGTVDLEQQHRSAGASPDFIGLDPLSVAAVLAGYC